MSARMWEMTYDLADERATTAFGAGLANRLAPEDTVGLIGPLGAGKSTLARAMISKLTGQSDVPSPTFGLALGYETHELTIPHYDLYRLKGSEELLEIGLYDALGRDLCIIEWPEKAATALPPETLLVILSMAGKSRQLTLRGEANWGTRLTDFNPSATNSTP